MEKLWKEIIEIGLEDSFEKGIEDYKATGSIECCVETEFKPRENINLGEFKMRLEDTLDEVAAVIAEYSWCQFSVMTYTITVGVYSNTLKIYFDAALTKTWIAEYFGKTIAMWDNRAGEEHEKMEEAKRAMQEAQEIKNEYIDKFADLMRD